MMRTTIVALLVAPAVAEEEGFVPKCTGLLGGVAKSSHTDLEVAAFCRQAYTPDMCSTIRSSLGPMPWPEAKIQTACEKWGGDLEDASERDLLTYREFNEVLDTSARKKKEMGYDMPRHRDGTVNLDEAVKKKFQETQVVVRTYNAYYGGGGANAQKGSYDAPVFAKLLPKHEVRKWTMAALSEDLAGGPQMAACGLALVALVAAVSVPLVRAVRRSQQPQPEEGVLLDNLEADNVE